MVTILETGSPRTDGSNHGVREAIAVSDGDDDVSYHSSAAMNSDDDDLEEERRRVEKELIVARLELKLENVQRRQGNQCLTCLIH